MLYSEIFESYYSQIVANNFQKYQLFFWNNPIAPTRVQKMYISDGFNNDMPPLIISQKPKTTSISLWNIVEKLMSIFLVGVY